MSEACSVLFMVTACLILCSNSPKSSDKSRNKEERQGGIGEQWKDGGKERGRKGRKDAKNAWEREGRKEGRKVLC